MRLSVALVRQAAFSMLVAAATVTPRLAAAAPVEDAGLQQPAAQAPTKGKVAKEKEVQTVEFDHLNTNGDRAYSLNLADGETFQIKVLNTCKEGFDYEVRGIERQTAPSDPEVKSEAKLDEKTLPVVHDEKYGGYIVTIKRAGPQSCTGGEKLVDRTLMISTPKMSWDLSFSGGFTLSNLKNPQYFLRPHPTETGKKQVQEDSGKEDDANLGIATYVHLYHHRAPWLAGTFGLGIRDGNKTEYFLGAGFRFSDKATINAGVAFGPVSRLKTGINVNDATSDDNVLTDLPTRTKRGFFIGISYSFIDVRGKLTQPFAGATGASGETNSTAKPPTAACQATLTPDTVTLGPEVGAKATVKLAASPAGCEWKVTAGVPVWVAVDPPQSGKGDATLTITAKEALGAAERTAKVEVGGKLLTILQKK